MRASALILTAAAAGLLAGCPEPAKPPPPPEPAPEIVRFSVSPAELKAGETATLSWETKNAASVKIVQVGTGDVSGVDKASGTVEVAVQDDVLFVLTARNERGVEVSAAAAVQVDEPADKVLFVALPDEIDAGGTATLAWTAPGAEAVSLATSEGQAVELGAQREAGAVSVTPAATTTYVLTVDGLTYPQTLVVRPAVGALLATPSAVNPGETLTLTWQTSGAASVDLALAGVGVVHQEQEASKVADGSFSFAVPADIDPAAALSFTITAWGPERKASTAVDLTVFITGAPMVRTFNVPPLALSGGTYEVSWLTTGADRIELLVDGTVVYQSGNLAEVDRGSKSFPTPAVKAELMLRAVNSRGGISESPPKLVEAIGKPVVTGGSFVATPSGGIQTGGEPATLTWNVVNARNVKITDEGGRLIAQASGTAAETGTVDVYPNADTDYILEADNTIGDSATATTTVAVATPARLVFAPHGAPAGAPVHLVGTTTVNGGALTAWNFVQKNVPGDAFYDISDIGNPVTIGSSDDTEAYLVTLPAPFTTTLFDVPISASKVSISTNGWLVFSNTAVKGPSSPPTTFPSTTLEPLAIAPYSDDLENTAATEIDWLIDGTGPQQRLIVQWTDTVPWLSSGKTLTFQAQIYASGTVVFAYDTVSGLATTDKQAIGIVNADESGALAVTADQYADGVHVSPGDTFRLFGEVTLPYEVKARTENYVFRQAVATASIELAGAPAVVPLADFAITEINVTPAQGVTDGQWFEIENKTAQPIDLGGWTLYSGAGSHSITSGTILPASGRMVFAQAAAAGDGVTVDYVYGTGVSVPAGGNLIIAGSQYASLALPQLSLPEGSTWQVGPVAAGMTAATGVTELECLAASTSTYGANGQLGTPGAANTPCPGRIGYTGAIAGNFEPLAPLVSSGAATEVTFSDLDDAIATITLPTPVKVDGLSFPSLVVGTNGYISLLPMTCDAYCWSSNKAEVDPNPSSTSLPKFGLIAPFWDDNDLSAHGGVYWARIEPGLQPNDGYLVVSWENIHHYTSTSDDQSGDDLNFQVKFFDTGTVEFHYGTMLGEDGSGATTWFEHPSGKAAFIVNVNSATPGIASNTAYRFAAQ